MSNLNQKKSLKRLNMERNLKRKKMTEQTFVNAALEYKNGFHDGNTEENIKQCDVSYFNYGDSGSKSSDNVSVNEAHPFTLSIAVPSSILDNTQSLDMKAFLVGCIARAACIYCVDEIIVFDDMGLQNRHTSSVSNSGEGSCKQFAQFLHYLECPQYLRKHLFPLNKDLQYAAHMFPLDAPHHHLHHGDDLPFREGVVSHHLLKQGKGSYVNVGLVRDVCVQKALVPGTRVTVHLQTQKDSSKKRYGEVVSPSLPRKLTGVYWGYSVRVATSFSEVFMKAPYEEGYDLTIGTSDKGIPLTDCADSEFQGFKHVLVVFGGLNGLEYVLKCDENLNIDNVSLLFDKYLNICPKQGSKIIRTEEAVLISLALIVPRLSVVNNN